MTSATAVKRILSLLVLPLVLALLAFTLFLPLKVVFADESTTDPATQPEEVTLVNSGTEEATKSTATASEQDFIPEQEISEDYPIALPADI